MSDRAKIRPRYDKATTPIVLDRSEVLNLVYSRICDIRSQVELCDEIAEGYGDHTVRVFKDALRQIDADAKRAQELIDALPIIDAEPTP